MSDAVSRREALRQLGVAGAGIMLGGNLVHARAANITIAGQPVEIAVATLSDSTVRITVRPIQQGVPAALPITGELAADAPGKRPRAHAPRRLSHAWRPAASSSGSATTLQPYTSKPKRALPSSI